MTVKIGRWSGLCENQNNMTDLLYSYSNRRDPRASAPWEHPRPPRITREELLEHLKNHKLLCAKPINSFRSRRYVRYFDCESAP